MQFSGRYAKKELSVYSKAGSVAEEVISSIKTVAAFGCQDMEVERCATYSYDDFNLIFVPVFSFFTAT